jgi:hypothetical protein
VSVQPLGGLRCPSEHLALTWGVNWERERITVRSPKTARLSEEHVIRRYRDSRVNLRTQVVWIIKRAGLTPWPKLFQNMRASRETELAREFPSHVAAEWLGHSALVAQKHYWRVTDEDFGARCKCVCSNRPKVNLMTRKRRTKKRKNPQKR